MQRAPDPSSIPEGRIFENHTPVIWRQAVVRGGFGDGGFDQQASAFPAVMAENKRARARR